jgi:hypothetical protein
MLMPHRRSLVLLFVVALAIGVPGSQAQSPQALEALHQLLLPLQVSHFSIIFPFLVTPAPLHNGQFRGRCDRMSSYSSGVIVFMNLNPYLF